MWPQKSAIIFIKTGFVKPNLFLSGYIVKGLDNKLEGGFLMQDERIVDLYWQQEVHHAVQFVKLCSC